MERFKSTKTARTPEQLAKNALNQALRGEIQANKWPETLAVTVNGVGKFDAKPIVSLKSGRILYNIQGRGVGPDGSEMKFAGNLFTDFALPSATYNQIMSKYGLAGSEPSSRAQSEDEALSEAEVTE